MIYLTILPRLKWKKLGFLKDKLIYPENFAEKAKRNKMIKISFKNYVEMAEWLEKHKNLKNCVMHVRASTETGLPRKVLWDGINVWVENYGFI